MTKDEIREKAIFIINKLESEGSYVIPHYLVLYVIGSALAKTGTEFPIEEMDPITMSLVREIRRISPELFGFDLNEVRIAVCKYLQENDYADKYFDYRK